LAGYAQLSFVIYAIFGWICAIGVRWKYTAYGVYLGVVRNKPGHAKTIEAAAKDRRENTTECNIFTAKELKFKNDSDHIEVYHGIPDRYSGIMGCHSCRIRLKIEPVLHSHCFGCWVNNQRPSCLDYW